MPLYERHPTRELTRPVLVYALDGWIDAGFGAATAMAGLLGAIETEPLATFDADVLLDQRARRPVMRLVDGINTSITWPETTLRVGRDVGGNDVLVLSGPEPDFHWRAFSLDVLELARESDVRIAVGFGAFPAPVPHTRAVRLASTSTSPELAAQVGYVPGTIDVPAPAQAVIERLLGESGIPAVGLWARVPHYASAMPYPPAALALLDGLMQVAGLELDISELRETARGTRERIDELIANSDEHGEMVRQLEHQIDEEQRSPFGPGDLPSGDEIAAELERFLRDN